MLVFVIFLIKFKEIGNVFNECDKYFNIFYENIVWIVLVNILGFV